jgi:hypothetical protein
LRTARSHRPCGRSHGSDHTRAAATGHVQ